MLLAGVFLLRPERGARQGAGESGHREVDRFVKEQIGEAFAATGESIRSAGPISSSSLTGERGLLHPFPRRATIKAPPVFPVLRPAGMEPASCPNLRCVLVVWIVGVVGAERLAQKEAEAGRRVIEAFRAGGVEEIVFAMRQPGEMATGMPTSVTMPTAKTARPTATAASCAG